MKHFGTLFFFIILGFAVWSIAASTPDGRIERACLPTYWGMKAISSAGYSLNAGWARTAAIAAPNLDYRCKLTIWNFFYGSEWHSLGNNQQNQDGETQ